MANILVVDDSAADRELAGHLLEEHAWTVVYAEDGKEALAQMQANAVDLVLTDRPENLEHPTGRGVFVMNIFMDDGDLARYTTTRKRQSAQAGF